MRWGRTMAGRVFALALVCALAACQRASGAPGPLTRAPDGRGLSLTFSDDFDGFRPWRDGKGVWRTTYGDGSDSGFDHRTLRWNKEVELYVDAGMHDAQGPVGLDPFEVRDGILRITGARAPEALADRLGGFRYTSGLITSQPSFSQRYGYFEMRAALPRGKGLWPAFWMLPVDQSWPPEIDVMESVGDPARVFVTVHSKTRKAEGVEAHTYGEGFHTFAVAWDPSQLIWYVDGVEVARQPTPPDLDKPMYLVANLAMGGDWAGQPDATTPLPAVFAIDYIRAYRFVP